MDNDLIADQLSLLAKLMDIHGENAFKSKSYAVAAFALEKLEQPVAQLSEAQLAKIRNVGESAARKISELLLTGEIAALNDIISKTPKGVLDMLTIKGLGPKKIYTLWKQMNIDSLDELQLACEEHRIAAAKGFGEKTEQKILEAIGFRKQNSGKYLYAQIEDFAHTLTGKLQAKFENHAIVLTGDFRRQLEIVSTLEWVTTLSAEKLIEYLTTENTTLVSQDNDAVMFQMDSGLRLQFHLSGEPSFGSKLLQTSASMEFLESFGNIPEAATEEDVFKKAGHPFIPAWARETSAVLTNPADSFADLIQVNEIKGLIHCHSDWSDGAYTIEAMAEALIAAGFEYMVISDHSKAAFYANGLSEDRIVKQHAYIDALNKKLSPFKIFKGIECDILGDGSLDYSDEVLASFDLLITSIHSNLDMGEEKAMQRLLGAIRHPQTRILGHMTGRLLLKRSGYPVDHKMIIDACAENDVVIEINSNPRRLDMDWRWIPYALEKGVTLSINPDAHSIDEFAMIKYGVLVAQKAGLKAKNNLSSYSLAEFEAFLQKKKSTAGNR